MRCCPDTPDTPVDATVVPVVPAVLGTLVLLSASPFSRTDTVGGKENNNIRNFSQPRIRSRCTGCPTIQIYDVAHDLNILPYIRTRFESLNISSDSALDASRNMSTTYVRRNALVSSFSQWFELLGNVPACPSTIMRPKGVVWSAQ